SPCHPTPFHGAPLLRTTPAQSLRPAHPVCLPPVTGSSPTCKPSPSPTCSPPWAATYPMAAIPQPTHHPLAIPHGQPHPLCALHPGPSHTPQLLFLSPPVAHFSSPMGCPAPPKSHPLVSLPLPTCLTHICLSQPIHPILMPHPWPT
ncbi:hypothetical protein PAXRUDRAFT_160295, partial [Paxillus rubicundulus Ve08.2h10]